MLTDGKEVWGGELRVPSEHDEILGIVMRSLKEIVVALGASGFLPQRTANRVLVDLNLVNV